MNYSSPVQNNGLIDPIESTDPMDSIKDETLLVGYYMRVYNEEYKAISKLALYDKKVRKHINTHYPEDDIFNLIKTVEYYKELDNVENGIYKNTPFSLYAQKRYALFNKMSDATYNYSCKNGKEKAFKMMDIIKKYIDEMEEELEFLI